MRTVWNRRIGAIALALMLTAGVAHAAPVYRGVQVSSTQSETTLTVRLSSSFTYTTYHPSETLLLVDIHAALIGSTQPLVRLDKGPINSYHVFNYTGANGENVLRLEITLAAGSTPAIAVRGTELLVRATASATQTPAPTTAQPATSKGSTAISKSSAASNKSSSASNMSDLEAAAAAKAAQNEPISAATSSAATSGARLVGIEVVHNAGTAVVIDTAPAVPKFHTMRLHHPERLVLDFDKTTDTVKQQRWPGDDSVLASVRAAQFSRETSRVVLDLKRSFEPSISTTASALRIDFAQNSAKTTEAKHATPSSSQSAPAEATASANTPGTPHLQSVAMKMQPASAATQSKPTAMAGKSSQASQQNGVLLDSFENPKVQATGIRKNELAGVARSEAVNVPAPATSVVPGAKSLAPGAATSANSKNTPAMLPAANSKASAVAKAGHRQDATAASGVPPTQTLGEKPAPPPAPVAEKKPQVTPKGVPPRSLMQPLPESTSTGLPLTAYTGERITLNLKNADLKDFFRLIHEVSGLNVVVDPNVTGTVTMVLDDVPWDQALDIVLRNNQLGRQLEGNVLRIATMATLQAEAKQISDLESARAKAVPLKTEVKQVSYAKAADLVTTLKKFVGERGDITPDPRTNTLIIEAPAEAFPTIDTLIQRLDQRTSQVEVEARVVAATRNFTRELGVQLGFGSGNGVATVGGVTAVGTGQTVVGTPNPTYAVVNGGLLPLNVNLGANAPTSGVSFINVTNTYRIDAILTAAESRGLGHVLSRPKIITQNNTQAEVEQGVRIPIQTTINNTITVQFFPVTLRLTVTPQITADRTIFMQVDVKNEQIDPGIPRVNGIPAIDTQGATTNVMVTDGGTVVVGGVMINNNNSAVFQVPVLGSLPVLGNLFKHSTVTNSSQELLFFITPRIVQS